MVCPTCEQVMHMDSKGVCACISCGYQYDQAKGVEVAGVLEERGSNYGSFESNARVAQELKETARSGARWNDLSLVQREAIDMILHKVARAVNGDPSYADTWVDISGYSQLVTDDLRKVENES